MPHQLRKGDQTATTTAEKIDLMNQHFVNTGKETRQKLDEEFSHRPRKSFVSRRINRSIYLFPATNVELVQVIRSLRCKAATGLDGIDTRTLKSVTHDLAETILPLMNNCLLNGHFPSTFKKTLVIPVYKGTGDRADCNNYRPISIISNLAKIFEKLLYERIMHFLVQEKFFSPSQFGFQLGSNTTTAVLHAIDRIKCGLDDGKHVTALFLDISKAFDCVDHTLLLDKLEKAGIRGKAHELIVDYLFGRELRVRSDGVLSVESFMTTGIPQGSSLSTLLYLVYTNDLYDLALQGYFQSFADDTMAVYAADTPTQLQEMIQQDTDLLADWFYSNHLSISTGKTRLMNFSLRTRPFQPQVVYNNTLLVSSSVYKYLGFHIDDRLTFSEHLEHIKARITCGEK